MDLRQTREPYFTVTGHLTADIQNTYPLNISYLSGRFPEQYCHVIILMPYYTATHIQNIMFSVITFRRMCISLVLYLIYAVKEVYKKYPVNRPYSTILCS